MVHGPAQSVTTRMMSEKKIPVAPESIAPDEPVPSGVAVRHELPRLLIVDDDPLLRRALQRVFRAHYAVTTVEASEGVALVTKGERFDVILCDVMMPDMDGLQFHDTVAAIEPSQVERFVFMTGGVGKSQRERLVELGKPVMPKPFTLSEFFANVGEDRKPT